MCIVRFNVSNVSHGGHAATGALFGCYMVDILKAFSCQFACAVHIIPKTSTSNAAVKIALK